ncbi:MAG: hypothetical protein ACK5UE_01935 [Chitinophagales bacterium]|jgi:hypothetical protein|nr:hypothetical protein [Sphingobacteriales bacterium]
MKFNPIKNELYTDSGELLKKLHCPYRMAWEDMERTNAQNKKCSQCQQIIIDTAYLTDEEVKQRLRAQPTTCLKIDYRQTNLSHSPQKTMTKEHERREIMNSIKKLFKK